MEHPRTKRNHHQEQQADARAQRAADGGVESRLAEGADDSQAEPHDIECKDLVTTVKYKRAGFGCGGVQADVQPAANRVDR